MENGAFQTFYRYLTPSGVIGEQNKCIHVLTIMHYELQIMNYLAKGIAPTV